VGEKEAMKLLRHFTANEEQLDPFPFRRELSMEAYLLENEGVLVLDDDTFSMVEIVEAELTLKEGRSSKETDGRIDILVSYSQEYIGIVELKLGELEALHLQQLEEYLEKKELTLNHPEIRNSVLSDDPKWVGILVGSSINSELAAKITDGYSPNGVPIAALTIQRFRSTKGNVYVTTDVYFKDTRKVKDKTKYVFNGNKKTKNRLVLDVIKKHIENHPEISFAALEKQFPKGTQGSTGVFATEQRGTEVYRNTGHKRYFIKPEELIKLSDVTIAVCNQWGVDNIGTFIEIARKLGYEIEESKN
jgi:hypothetical protein